MLANIKSHQNDQAIIDPALLDLYLQSVPSAEIFFCFLTKLPTTQ